jgi:hypothetical protein
LTFLSPGASGSGCTQTLGLVMKIIMSALFSDIYVYKTTTDANKWSTSFPELALSIGHLIYNFISLF